MSLLKAGGSPAVDTPKPGSNRVFPHSHASKTALFIPVFISSRFVTQDKVCFQEMNPTSQDYNLAMGWIRDVAQCH
jgi:hypothetical protein